MPNDSKIRMILKVTIFPLIIGLHFTSCMTTKIPDKYILDEQHTNTQGYTLYQNSITGGNKVERTFSPNQELYIDFSHGIYGEYYNNKKLEIIGRLFISEVYETLTIHELMLVIDEDEYVILKNIKYKIPDISNDNLLLNNDNEILIIDGKSYYWIYCNSREKIDSHFIKNRISNGDEITLVQTYSFDNNPTKKEEVIYRVIPGRYKFDPLRLIYPFFPP